MSVRVRFPPEAREGRLPPSLLCYCPSPQPLSLAERGGAHALSAPADRAFAVPSRLFIHPPQTVLKVSARVEKSVPHYRGDYEFSILGGGTFTFKTVSPSRFATAPVGC